MNTASLRRANFALAIMAVASLTLSACATKSDRRGPPADGERRGGQARQSGTFMQPIAVLLADMDTNKDKMTTLEELHAGAEIEWSKFNRNPSAAYFAQWSMTNLGSTDAMPSFMSFDRDFNGVITEAEFNKRLEGEFKALDKNADGKVERSELIVAFAAPQGERSRNTEQQGRGGGRGQGGGRPPR